MSNLYRGPSKDASYMYQVLIHLAKLFQRRWFFRNQPIRNKNCLWWPCLLTDRDETSILYRGPSIDASYQVAVHLAKLFQRRRPLKIGQSETRIACGGQVFNESGQNVQSLERTFCRCFLPSFSSFGKVVSEEKIFLEINQSETRTACGGHVCKRIGIKWAIFIEDLPKMLPTKFWFIWTSCFRGEDFLEINQSETRIACGGHVC